MSTLNGFGLDTMVEPFRPVSPIERDYAAIAFAKEASARAFASLRLRLAW